MENFFWGGRDDALRGPISGEGAVVNGTMLAFLSSFGSDGKTACPQASQLHSPAHVHERRRRGFRRRRRRRAR